MERKKVVVFTGAGISKESGIPTYRDLDDGLWNEYDFNVVASIQGWNTQRDTVQKFYNERRAQLKDIEPNRGHYGVADLDDYFDVTVITQNVDDLHERAGSKNIMHLHGLLTEACSEANKSIVKEIGYEPINEGDLAPDGHQLRPNIVWFGEPVPSIQEAIDKVFDCDILIVIGTSLNVQPAAGLLDVVRENCEIYFIDPNIDPIDSEVEINYIWEPASQGIDTLLNDIVPM